MKIIKMMMVIVVMMLGVALGDNVDGTCKHTPDYIFCVSLLRSDPRSSSADTAGLALILVDKIKELGINAIGQIKKVYKTKPILKRALDECNFRYKVIIENDLEEAYQALPGNPKFAENGVADAKIEASICEEGFSKGQSFLTNLNLRIEKICDVARAIIRMLL